MGHEGGVYPNKAGALFHEAAAGVLAHGGLGGPSMHHATYMERDTQDDSHADDNSHHDEHTLRHEDIRVQHSGEEGSPRFEHDRRDHLELPCTRPSELQDG